MSQRIRIRHPLYKTPNTLFTFPASDGPDRDHAHYATIWLACSIFTNNRQDHWLSTSPGGEPRASPDVNGLLPANDYFLHVHNISDDPKMSRVFPIVPNFRSWRYPHDSLPPLWHKASQTDDSFARQTNFSIESIAIEHCRITKRQLEVDNSHILPVSEKLWFTNNEMEEYGDLRGRSGEIIADSLANLLRLRCDAHRLWDKLNFSIVSREDRSTESGAAWFTQAISDGEELHKHWHNQRLEPLARRPAQYLLARFAWDIFPKLHSFLQAGRGRLLVFSGLDGTVETRQCTEAECRKFTSGQGRNRSASPTKRARSEVSSSAGEVETWQLGDVLEASNTSSFASSHKCSSDGADSAVAGMHKIDNDRKRRKYGAKANDESDWDRYACGLENEDRGRKRIRI